MAHFAYIDENNLVTSVIVGRDENDVPDSLGFETWEAYFSSLGKGQALRTSYNTKGGVHYTDGEPSADQSKAFRFNYAGIGFTYDEERDAFIPPKPYESWVLNEETCLWEAPVAYPEDGADYYWDEDSQAWVERV